MSCRDCWTPMLFRAEAITALSVSEDVACGVPGHSSTREPADGAKAIGCIIGTLAARPRSRVDDELT